MMIQSITKSQVIRLIQSLRSPKIEVMDIWGKSDKTKLTQHFDRMVIKGNFKIIFIKE